MNVLAIQDVLGELNRQLHASNCDRFMHNLFDIFGIVRERMNNRTIINKFVILSAFDNLYFEVLLELSDLIFDSDDELMLCHFEVSHHNRNCLSVSHRLLFIFHDVNSNDHVDELESRVATNVFVFARREAAHNLTVRNNFDQLIVFLKSLSRRLLQIPDLGIFGERADSNDGIAIRLLQPQFKIF